MTDDTQSEDYAERLQQRERARWKRWLNVQAPFQWNLRRLKLGFTLDVGCGIGRNLVGLRGIGVDHNPSAVAIARDRGLTAYTADEFVASDDAHLDQFDSLLLSHVVEHMTRDEAVALVARYLPFLRPGGRVVLIAPQEAGFRTDPTHVEFMDRPALRHILEANRLVVRKEASFPLMRSAGRFLRYNEFLAVGVKPAG
ncbi:MAG: class I SAM-dependent methyltransferase [Acidimicrobiia bacterium]|nr:class I SAM-dependent methyltransferase [Acidimicrobiia bacterium]